MGIALNIFEAAKESYMNFTEQIVDFIIKTASIEPTDTTINLIRLVVSVLILKILVSKVDKNLLGNLFKIGILIVILAAIEKGGL